MANIVKVLVVVALAAAIGAIAASCGGDNDKQARPGATGMGETAADCWLIRFDRNRGNRILSAGIPEKYHRTPAATTDFMLAVAKQDPRALQQLWNATPRGSANRVDDWRELVDSTGRCYSERGQDVWSATALQMRQAFAQKSQAPEYGENTLIRNGQATGRAQYIGGDRSGVAYTFNNGLTFWVMYRCANVVTPAPPQKVVPPKKKVPPVVPPKRPKPKPPEEQPPEKPKPPEEQPPEKPKPPRSGEAGPGTGTPGRPGGPGDGDVPGPSAGPTDGPMCRDRVSGSPRPGPGGSDGWCIDQLGPVTAPPTTGQPGPASGSPPQPAQGNCIDQMTMQPRAGPADQFGYCTG